MDVFLTGATGTIGQAVTSRLVARGHVVAALARSPESAERVRQMGAQPVAGDIRAPDVWIDKACEAGTLVHMAATFDAQAVEAERGLVAAVKELRVAQSRPFQLIYTGGIWLYPANTATPLRENTAFSPLPAFAHVANAIRSLLPMRHLSVSVIHPALVCARDDGPVADMRHAAQTGMPFATHARHDTLWPLVEAGDLADLYARAVEARRYRLTAFGCGISAIPVSTLMRLVAQRLGLRLDLAETLATRPRAAELDISAGYALSQSVDASRAKDILGWQPRFTQAEELVHALTSFQA